MDERSANLYCCDSSGNKVMQNSRGLQSRGEKKGGLTGEKKIFSDSRSGPYQSMPSEKISAFKWIVEEKRGVQACEHLKCREQFRAGGGLKRGRRPTSVAKGQT